MAASAVPLKARRRIFSEATYTHQLAPYNGRMVSKQFHLPTPAITLREPPTCSWYVRSAASCNGRGDRLNSESFRWLAAPQGRITALYPKSIIHRMDGRNSAPRYLGGRNCHMVCGSTTASPIRGRIASLLSSCFKKPDALVRMLIRSASIVQRQNRRTERRLFRIRQS
jgi:hypothetical protein